MRVFVTGLGDDLGRATAAGAPGPVSGTVGGGGPHPPGRPGDVTLDCSRAAALLRTPLRGVGEALAT